MRTAAPIVRRAPPLGAAVCALWGLFAAGCASHGLWEDGADALPAGEYQALQAAHARLLAACASADGAALRAVMGGLAGNALAAATDAELGHKARDLQAFYGGHRAEYVGARALGRRRALAVDYTPAPDAPADDGPARVQNVYYFVPDGGGWRLELWGNREIFAGAPAEVFYELVRALKGFEDAAGRAQVDWLLLYDLLAPELFEAIDRRLGPEGMEVFARRLQERALEHIFVSQFTPGPDPEPGARRDGRLAAVVSRPDGRTAPLDQPLRFVCMWEQPPARSGEEPTRLWRLADEQLLPAAQAPPAAGTAAEEVAPDLRSLPSLQEEVEPPAGEAHPRAGVPHAADDAPAAPDE